MIFYWAKPDNRVLLLLIYSKSKREDLTGDQLRILRRIVEEEFR